MKKLTVSQIKEMAIKHKMDYASLKAVSEVECKSSGFNENGTPKILLERHVFWRRLGKINWYTMRKKIQAKHPTVCNRRSGGYGLYSEQHSKLAIACSYNRDVALESCSWGVGQVMGYHWKVLGYESLQQFINDMYESEVKQLEAMIRYIKVFGLVDDLNNQNWASFARKYNGKAYRKNNYDTKLATAYEQYA